MGVYRSAESTSDETRITSKSWRPAARQFRELRGAVRRSLSRRRGQWLSKVPARQRRLWLSIAGIAVVVLAVSLFETSAGGRSRGSPLGGWIMSAAFQALPEPLVAWGVILGLVHLFGRAFSRPGRTCAALS